MLGLVMVMVSVDEPPRAIEEGVNEAAMLDTRSPLHSHSHLPRNRRLRSGSRSRACSLQEAQRADETYERSDRGKHQTERDRPSSSIQVTVDTYGRLIPGANVTYVDLLDRKSALKSTFEQQPCATPAQPGENLETMIPAYLVDLTGGGRQDRTADLRVMNPSL